MRSCMWFVGSGEASTSHFAAGRNDTVFANRQTPSTRVRVGPPPNARSTPSIAAFGAASERQRRPALHHSSRSQHAHRKCWCDRWFILRVDRAAPTSTRSQREDERRTKGVETFCRLFRQHAAPKRAFRRRLGHLPVALRFRYRRSAGNVQGTAAVLHYLRANSTRRAHDAVRTGFEYAD